MEKYTIFFGIDFRNSNKLESIEKLKYCDNNQTKTIGDVKDFITCFNDNICSCMLKLYQTNYQRYRGKDEDRIKLKDIFKDGKIYIGQIEQECKCDFLKFNKMLISQNKKNLIEKINSLEKTEELKNIDFKDFYDIIININSIMDVHKGWKVEMTQLGEKKYKDYKDLDLIKIGIIGNVNKGKSFILSKLSKIDLPTGSSINTKGLSVKYPEVEEKYKNRRFILLDSAGFEKPILKDIVNEGDKKYEINEIKEEDEKDEINEIKEQDKKDEINEIKEEDKKDEIKDIKADDKKDEINEIKEKENLKLNDIYGTFKAKARDILITESFLQSFIISTCDLLLVAIDILSLSEQKLLNKIQKKK